MTVIKKIWVSEKATAAKKNNQYLFLVEARVNKNEIKKEISRKYGVKVEAVNIINIKGKEKKFGRHLSRRPSLKKAVVTLSPGHKIEIT